MEEKPKRTENAPISLIKKNPDNPRTIKDENFKKLVQSLKDFPEMMQLRPIVVNSDMVILGGNMRFEAAKAAGWKDVPVIIAELTPEQEREFIIKDNISGGDWDWNVLANEWDEIKLEEWGLNLPNSVSAKDLSDDIETKFAIEIILDNEEEQQKTYNKLIEEGYKCRVLTL